MTDTVVVPYAHWKSCALAFFEQFPIQISALWRTKTRYLFCYCAALADADGNTLDFNGCVDDKPATPVAFAERDRMESMIWGDVRFEGYAAAANKGLVDRVVLFGPQHELDFGKDVLVNTHNVDPDKIMFCVTKNSTITNATVMRQFLRTHSIPAHWVRMCSSAYHLRAPILAFDGCLLVRHMPAESFLFAGHVRDTDEGEAARTAIRERLMDIFGRCEMTWRIVFEIQGAHDSTYDREHYDRPLGG